MEQLSGNYTYTTTSTAPYVYTYAGDPTQPLATSYSNVTIQEYGNSVVLTPKMINTALDSIKTVGDLQTFLTETDLKEEEDLWNS